MQQLFKYLHLWTKLTLNSFSVAFTSKLSASLFLVGKICRFVFMILFVLTLFSRTQMLAGYTLYQVLFFYLTFTILDNAAQLFYREVYRFRPMVVSGDFDLVLVKPMNPLFRALAGGADPLDLMLLVPYIGLLWFVGSKLGTASVTSVLLYVALCMNGFLIMTGFHIIVLALAVLTTEIDHAIMIFRDLTSMARIPVDMYREPLRSLLTFVIPVGIMMTFPAKAFLGLLSPLGIVLSLGIGVVFFLVSLRVWRMALTRYASASS